MKKIAVLMLVALSLMVCSGMVPGNAEAFGWGFGCGPAICLPPLPPPPALCCPAPVIKWGFVRPMYCPPVPVAVRYPVRCW